MTEAKIVLTDANYKTCASKMRPNELLKQINYARIILEALASGQEELPPNVAMWKGYEKSLAKLAKTYDKALKDFPSDLPSDYRVIKAMRFQGCDVDPHWLCHPVLHSNHRQFFANSIIMEQLATACRRTGALLEEIMQNCTDARGGFERLRSRTRGTGNYTPYENCDRLYELGLPANELTLEYLCPVT